MRGCRIFRCARATEKRIVTALKKFFKLPMGDLEPITQVLRYPCESCSGHEVLFPPLQGKGEGGDGFLSQVTEPHPPPNLQLEGGGAKWVVLDSSFPRRRNPELFKCWMPAFAGMTKLSARSHAWINHFHAMKRPRRRIKRARAHAVHFFGGEMQIPGLIFERRGIRKCLGCE